LNRILVALQIVCLSTWAAIVYGILHDQVTVRVCLEYFTVGHVPIFGDQPPTILAILWGTTASWWMGAFLGIFLALALYLTFATFIRRRRANKPDLPVSETQCPN
jgi:phosphotransferase system  glucose/maltose/N-acetylglucosamine-specific IIC component